jgi:hypothetical protein
MIPNLHIHSIRIYFVFVIEKERMELANADPNGKHIKEFIPQHIDHKNADSFGHADLERLIQHASKDLDEIDREREQQFKEYEMRKEYERRAKLAVIDFFSF